MANRFTNGHPQTAEPMEMAFGMWTKVGPRKHVLDGAHWRHLAITIEPFMCSSDAAFLSNFFDYLLLIGRVRV